MDLYDSLVSDPAYLGAFKDTLVLGVAGTNGAGKDSLMALLAQEGFYVYSVGDRLRHIAKASLGSPRRGGNDSPSGRVANAERTRFPGGMFELGMIEWWSNIAHFPQELQPRGLVIGSLRVTGEAARLKEIGGKL